MLSRFCCRKFLLLPSGPPSRVWPTSWVTWCLQLPLRSKPVSMFPLDFLHRSCSSRLFHSWWRTLHYDHPNTDRSQSSAELCPRPGYFHRSCGRLPHRPHPRRPREPWKALRERQDGIPGWCFEGRRELHLRRCRWNRESWKWRYEGERRNSACRTWKGGQRQLSLRSRKT